MIKKLRFGGIGLVVLAAVLWGTSGIVGKVLTGDFGVPAITVAAWRLAAAAPVLQIARGASRGAEEAPVRKKDRKWLLIYGLAVALYQLCYFCATDFAPVSLVTIISLCLTPVFVVLLGWPILHERITGQTLFAIAVSIAGTVLMVGVGGAGGGKPLGFLLAAGAGFCYSFYNLCGKNLSGGYRPIRIVAVVFTIGAVLLSPALLLTPRLTAPGVLCLLYLGLVPTALAFVLFQAGLRSCRAASASVASLCEPMTSVLLSVFLLHESFRLPQMVGAVLMITAIFMLTRGERGARS